MADGINYHDRRFVLASNTAGDAVPGQTRFHFRHEGRIVWATYEGGRVARGQLIGLVDDEGRLDVRFQQVTVEGELKTGGASAVPDVLSDGRVRLREKWHFSDGGEGEAVFEEAEGQG